MLMVFLTLALAITLVVGLALYRWSNDVPPPKPEGRVVEAVATMAAVDGHGGMRRNVQLSKDLETAMSEAIMALQRDGVPMTDTERYRAEILRARAKVLGRWGIT